MDVDVPIKTENSLEIPIKIENIKNEDPLLNPKKLHKLLYLVNKKELSDEIGRIKGSIKIENSPDDQYSDMIDAMIRTYNLEKSDYVSKIVIPKPIKSYENKSKKHVSKCGLYKFQLLHNSEVSKPSIEYLKFFAERHDIKFCSIIPGLSSAATTDTVSILETAPSTSTYKRPAEEPSLELLLRDTEFTPMKKR